MFDKIKIYLTGGILCLCMIASPLASLPVSAKAAGNQLFNPSALVAVNPTTAPTHFQISNNGRTVVILSDRYNGSNRIALMRYNLMEYAGKTLTLSYNSWRRTGALPASYTPIYVFYVYVSGASSGSKSFTIKPSASKQISFSIPEDATQAYINIPAFCSTTAYDQTRSCGTVYGDIMLNEGSTALPWETYQEYVEPEPEPKPNPEPTPKPDPETPSDALSMFTPLIAFVVGLIDLITANEYLLFFLCFTLIGIGIGVLRKMSDSLR